MSNRGMQNYEPKHREHNDFLINGRNIYISYKTKNFEYLEAT